MRGLKFKSGYFIRFLDKVFFKYNLTYFGGLYSELKPEN